MSDEQRQGILKAVENAKKSQFGVTAIKVELEAQLDRPGDSDDTCYYCDGDGEAYDDDEGEYVTCWECHGNGNTGDSDDFGSETYCQQFILGQLVQYGMATGSEGAYQIAGPLTFARFYNDGSVDSEFTFTVALDDPENIFLLPKVIDAFNALAAEIGNGIDVAGAGMHTALISHPEFRYGSNWRQSYSSECWRNFQRSMTPLLPALYFLAAPNGETRQMSYRVPQVSGEEKYSAIALRYGALEYRVFDTCYDNPDQVLDNFVVMSNSLKYWSRTLKDTRIDRVLKGSRLYFGNYDSERELTRLYRSTTHLDVLNHGLKLLKPSYTTISELKAQRQFKLRKPSFKKAEAEAVASAKAEFKEYADRNSWLKRIMLDEYRSNLMRDYLNSHRHDLSSRSFDSALDEVAPRAQELLQRWEREQLDEPSFIRRRIQEYQSSVQGHWCLV